MSPRLSTREKLQRLLEIFSQTDKVLLPIIADPDALASALAFRRLLWRRVAATTIAPINEIKRLDNLALVRLLRIKLIPFDQIEPAGFDRLVLVDAQPGHHDLLAQLNFDVIIDHHPLEEETKARFVDIRPTYGATATILTEFLRAAKITPSRSLATAIFYAIRTDTDSFSRPSVEEDMRAFRYLYRFADHNLIRKIESAEISLSLLKYYRQALERIKIRGEKAFVFLDQVPNPDVLVMIADFLMHIQAIDTVVVAAIHEGKLVIVCRNARGRRNVGRLAERAFGKLGRAGGHQAAARAEVPLAALKEIGQSLEPKALEKFIIRAVKGQR